MSQINSNLLSAAECIRTAKSKLESLTTMSSGEGSSTPERPIGHRQTGSPLDGNPALLEERNELIDSQSGLSPTSDAYAETQARIDALNTQIERNLQHGTAPILVLPPGGGNLPADPVDFIDESKLVEDKTGWFDETKYDNRPNSDKPSFDPSELQDLGDNYYLTPGDDIRLENIGSEDAPVFQQIDIDGDPPQVTYHVFYAYNDGPLSQNHQGDWEQITVNLDPDTLAPESVTYSAHGGGTTVPYDDVKDPVTGQPIVFVAHGSHANYPTPGSHPTNVDFLKDNTITIDNADAVVINTRDQLAPVAEQEWYPEEGNEGVKWGEQGSPVAGGIIGTNGPTGPSSEKGHLDVQPIHQEPPTTGPPTGTTTTTVPPPVPESESPSTTVPPREGPPTGTTTTTTTIPEN